MTNRLRRTLSLTLSLLLLVSLCAYAEETPPSADHLNMALFTIDNIRYDTGSGETELPLSLETSLGMDAARKRGMALINVSVGDSALTMMGSVESDEVRAQISGIEQSIAIPLSQAEDMLIQNTLLMGMSYDEISEETRAALTEYLALTEEALLAPTPVVDSSDLLDAYYPEESWREDYEKYPALLNAAPAGEEEITLYGQTYTAKKYTYSIERATEEEFDAFYAAYDDHYYGATGALDEAYARLMDLVYEDFMALYGEDSELWTDDGTLSESESGSLSEWDESEQYEYYYSIEGTIWQVDEVLGMLEQYTATTHAPDGDYTDSYTYSDMRTENCVRYESTQTSSDDYGYTSSYSDSTSITVDESGNISVDGFTRSGVEYAVYDYSYLSDTRWQAALTGKKIILALDQTIADSDYTETFNSIEAEFDIGVEAETGLMNQLDGVLQIRSDSYGNPFSASMDMNMLWGTLPEGILLPLTGEEINPLEADEETLNRLMDELEALLMQTFGSLIPAPETPSGIGGALLSAMPDAVGSAL